MKAFFLNRHIREKVLLTAFVALGAGIWLTSVGRRARVFWADWQGTAAVLASQRSSLGDRATVEAAAAKAVAHLDPSRTFSSPRLLGELSSIADRVGVRNNTSSEILGTERASQFSMNTVQFAIRNAELPAVLTFCDELDRRSPYIGLEQFSLAINPANPAFLNVMLRVSSVEMAPP
jgi:hypothetical protein